MRVLLCVTGSVAAIKVRPLVHALRGAGMEPRVVASNKGEVFVRSSIPGGQAPGPHSAERESFDISQIYSDAADRDAPQVLLMTARCRRARQCTPSGCVQAILTCIEMADWADVLLVAPLSANSLTKLALGLCDNFVTSIARCWDLTKPFLVAPAMNTKMWEHPATAPHIATLERWGVTVISPVVKVLACGDKGVGAMASVEQIVAAVRVRTSHGEMSHEGRPALQ